MSNGNPLPGTPDYIWQWTNDGIQNACSIGTAIVGVAATAMGALQMTMAGVQHPIVAIDLTAPLQAPRVVRIR